MKIKKKTWLDAFKKITSGEKTFDARLVDFKCKVSDVLVLEEYDSETKKYTGRKIEKKVPHILNTKKQRYWTESDIQKFGLQIMGLES